MTNVIEMEKCTMLGNKILQAIKTKNEKELHDFLNETYVRIQDAKKKNGLTKSYSKKFIVDSLFNWDTHGRFLKNHQKVSYYVVEEFLEFLLHSKDLSTKNSLLVKNFVFELGMCNVIDDFLIGGKPQTQDTFMHFKECFEYFVMDNSQSNLTKSMLVTFGLRQALELKFRRVLGIYDILDPNGNPVKLRHDEYIQFVLKEPSILIKMPPQEISCIKTIYDWTNISIHHMWTPPTWMIWKAYDFVSDFLKANKLEFKNTKGDIEASYWSIHGAVIIEGINTYKSLQQKFADRASRQLKMSVTLNCSYPEAWIIDKVSKIPVSPNEIPRGKVVGIFTPYKQSFLQRLLNLISRRKY